jgi:hypothetical protein
MCFNLRLAEANRSQLAQPSARATPDWEVDLSGAMGQTQRHSRIIGELSSLEQRQQAEDSG